MIPNGLTETLQLFDGHDVVAVSVAGSKGKPDLRLSGDQVKPSTGEPGIDFYVSQGDAAQAADHIAVGLNDGQFLDCGRRLPRGRQEFARRGQGQSSGLVSAAPRQDAGPDK